MCIRDSSKRSVETSLFIYDGHTVAIGGLITENVQTVEDKVPIFGDPVSYTHLDVYKRQRHTSAGQWSPSPAR